nr:MAG TPA: hypothetical protein [Caudoviricetes sp.]
MRIRISCRRGRNKSRKGRMAITVRFLISKGLISG